MSALWVKCPKCGPLFTFIPQQEGWSMDIKCSCGVQCVHQEGSHHTPGYQKALNKHLGKVPAQEFPEAQCGKNGFE